MENDLIFCLVGESGSGKTTIAQILEAEDVGIKNINSFTTRERRSPEESGHIFVKEELYHLDKESGFIAAETYFDNAYYWTTKDQLQGRCIYVIDVKGVEWLKKNCPNKKIIVIYLKCDERNRLIRMLGNRSAEIARQRIGHDREVFRIIECDYVVDTNRSIGEVLKDIKEIIYKFEAYEVAEERKED